MDLIGKISDDAEDGLRAELCLSCILNLVKQIAGDLLVDTVDAWHLAHILCSDELVDGPLLKVGDAGKNPIGNLLEHLELIVLQVEQVGLVDVDGYLHQVVQLKRAQLAADLPQDMRTDAAFNET